MIRLKHKNWNSILTKKQQKISGLSSGKIDKYEYLTGKKILPYNQRQTWEQAKFKYFPLVKAFWKQKQNDWRARKKINRSYYKLKPNTSGFNP